MRRLLLIFIVALAGCDNSATPDFDEFNGDGWLEHTYRGHTYLSKHSSGKSYGMVHNPECTCQADKKR